MTKSKGIKRVESESQIATKKEGFTPTEDMVLWVGTAIDLKTTNKVKISESCGIDRYRWYKTWKKKEGFIDWYLSEWNKGIREHGPELDEIGFHNAKRDHRYWQDMQKRVGNIRDRDNETNIPIQINNIIQKEKDEFGI